MGEAVAVADAFPKQGIPIMKLLHNSIGTVFNLNCFIVCLLVINELNNRLIIRYLKCTCLNPQVQSKV